MITIRQVRNTGGKYGRILQELHDTIFGDEAPTLELSNGKYWIAWDIHPNIRSPIGFAWAKHSSQKSGRLYFARAGVLPEWRGAGLQRRFIRAREQWARRNGFEEIVSDTSANIYSSNNLIVSGFRLFEPEVKWGFKHTLYWFKKL